MFAEREAEVGRSLSAVRDLHARGDAGARVLCLTALTTASDALRATPRAAA